MPARSTVNLEAVKPALAPAFRDLQVQPAAVWIETALGQMLDLLRS
jgi:hypothetical protein